MRIETIKDIKILHNNIKYKDITILSIIEYPYIEIRTRLLDEDLIYYIYQNFYLINRKKQYNRLLDLIYIYMYYLIKNKGFILFQEPSDYKN